MKLRHYFLIGCLSGIVLSAAVIAFSMVARHTFESVVVAVALPGFLPFASSDPEQEMSWLVLALAFLLNSLVFGGLALLLGSLSAWLAQPAAELER